MNETSGEADAATLAYFRLIEDEFLRLRGAVGLLSSADWTIADSWRVAGVPAELVLATLADVWRKRQERGGSLRRISSLKYFSPAVFAAWEEVRLLQGPRSEQAPRPIDVPERLNRLATALPDAYPGVEAWRARVRALVGDARMVEESLTALDRELLAQARRALRQADSDAVASTVEGRLRPLAGRLSVDQRAESMERLMAAAVRRHFELPILSLFAVGDEPQA